MYFLKKDSRVSDSYQGLEEGGNEQLAFMSKEFIFRITKKFQNGEW